MLKLIFNFSRAIQKSQNLLKQMRKNRYYIDDPLISQRKEAQQIVESLYFNKKNNLQQMLEKEEENKLENVIENLDEEINFRRFQTAQELLDFYEAKPLKSREQYLEWFNQLSYCLKFQEQIQQNKLNYYKKLAGQYKAQYNKEYEMPNIIFLTPTQILENPVFNQIIEDFVSNCEVVEWLHVRKQIKKSFQTQLYSLDYYALQRLWEDNQYPIQTIQYLSLIIKDIIDSKFEKDQEPQFMELYDGKFQQGQSLQKILEQVLIQKMQQINFYELNNQDFADFVFIYYQQQKLPILPTFLKELVDNVKERVSTLSLLENIKILQAMLAIEIGDNQSYCYLLWNIIRLKNRIHPDYQIINGIIFILLHFKQNILFMKARRNYPKPIIVQDAMVFSEIFNHITEDLSIFDFIQLSQLLSIANKNFADPAKLNAIIISLFQKPELNQNIQIDNKIELYYKATQMGQTILDITQILKYKVQLLQSHSITGFFEKNQQTDGNQIIGYYPYYTLLLESLIKLIWTSILQNSKCFEDINYLIFKVNELTRLQTSIKIDRMIQKMISQINQYINLVGKTILPNKIDIKQIQENKNIFCKQESYAHPLMLHTKLYMKEKFYFFKKYEKDLEKDVYYEDILLDFVYTNKRTGNKALILLNGLSNYQISAVGEMVPNTLINFQDDLLLKSQIPIIQINLPDIIKCQSKSFFEEQLKDILEDGSNEYEDIANIIQELRYNIKKDFNYLSIHQQKDEQESQPKIEEEVQNDDTYALSDQEN
ncbi:unnamed protein product [Paramecium pentaurelia]|uniref:Uncharacterized protein n=1 Tax=Paramecium pentaurelia TaxID=43138 RepID=A0A8S1W6Y8_9CILI|nr:unnamed protein product [Paramecium pentaurelia]